MSEQNRDRDVARHKQSVFLAGPFKALVDPITGRMRQFERVRYQALIGHLEGRGYSVHNAHKREAWGASFLAPEECTQLDYEEIRGCDLFIAFPGCPASPGTHIEIGWAAALGRPMMLLLEEGQTYAFLVRGLHAVADVTYVQMPADQVGINEFSTGLSHAETRLDHTSARQATGHRQEGHQSA